MPKVILKFEAAVIKEYPITSSSLTIGRESDNDIHIDHPAISRHHARIMLQGNTYFIEDLNSTNGTMINNKKIIKAGIHDQDVIQLSKHSLVFIDDRPAVPSAENQPQAEPVPIETPPPPTQEPSPESFPSLYGKPFNKIGGVRVIEGIVDQIDFQLTENSTYIGKSDRVTIKIKGVFAPEVVAMISKKNEGYALVAIKEGYPKVNGMPVQGERMLNEGDVIEVGSTKLQFYTKPA